MFFVFFKQKTAYEMRISDWSSDVCSSDLGAQHELDSACRAHPGRRSHPVRGCRAWWHIPVSRCLREQDARISGCMSSSMRTKASGEIKICPIEQALDMLGDAWSMLILRDAGTGVARFDDFRKNLSIAPNILTQRLVALTGAGLLERYQYSQRPPRFAHRLTGAGQAFLPILSPSGSWYTRNPTRLAVART